MAVIDPLSSSALSFVVGTENVTLPEVGTVTVRDPVVAPKSPTALIFTPTSKPADGAGLADTVNTASVPSVTSLPPEIDTTGSGSPESSFSISTLTEPPTVGSFDGTGSEPPTDGACDPVPNATVILRSAVSVFGSAVSTKFAVCAPL